jgi:hypothetical protein
MSISLKVYSSVLSIKEIVGRKSFRNSLIMALTVILFFGVFNVYAQEDKISPDYSGTKTFHNEMSGVPAEEDNMNSREGLEVLNSAWTALSLIAPEVTENGPEVMNNPNIPYDLRRGVLGMVEDAGDLVYASYPVINVPEHLAQQWVPGYQESVTSLYAQNSSVGHESGYSELMGSGIVKLWNRTLNLAYVAFVVIMIAAGFMIMFRHKLGGQTMVTIGNVLPGVITALILATFSFAIAGLIIDLGGVLTGLVAFILGDGAEIRSISSVGSLMGAILSGGVGATTMISGAIGAIGIGSFLGIGAGLGASALANPPVALAVLGAMGAIGIIIALVILGVILVGAVKVIIALFKAYFSLLLGVILGPIQITLGAMPGNSHMIKNWFLGILRNVLVFPVVLFIVNIPNALMNSGSEVLLKFPGKLVYEDPNTYDAGGIDVAGGLFIFILKIFVLYFAAQAPKFLEAWFPPNSPKAVGEGLASAQASLSKIPLVGGLFK